MVRSVKTTNSLPAIQADHSVRLVALSNLRAMCDRASGMCHAFAVETVTANRVTVSYSNPNEYGSECPVYASFAVIPSGFTGYSDSVFVILSILRVTGGRDSQDREDAFDMFSPVLDCEKLWHDPTSGKWQTEYEIVIARNPAFAIRSEWDKDGCVQTWFTLDKTSFNNWKDAQTHATKLAKDHEIAFQVDQGAALRALREMQG